jgi:hypothetical protein
MSDAYMLSRRFFQNADSRLPALDPKAEESLLQLGDEFISKVLEQALMLARGRGASQPEPQDLEFVFERLWQVQLPRPEPVDAARQVPKPAAMRERKDPRKIRK